MNIWRIYGRKHCSTRTKRVLLMIQRKWIFTHLNSQIKIWFASRGNQHFSLRYLSSFKKGISMHCRHARQTAERWRAEDAQSTHLINRWTVFVETSATFTVHSCACISCLPLFTFSSCNFRWVPSLRSRTQPSFGGMSTLEQRGDWTRVWRESLLIPRSWSCLLIFWRSIQN